MRTAQLSLGLRQMLITLSVHGTTHMLCQWQLHAVSPAPVAMSMTIACPFLRSSFFLLINCMYSSNHPFCACTCPFYCPSTHPFIHCTSLPVVQSAIDSFLAGQDVHVGGSPFGNAGSDGKCLWGRGHDPVCGPGGPQCAHAGGCQLRSALWSTAHQVGQRPVSIYSATTGSDPTQPAPQLCQVAG